MFLRMFHVEGVANVKISSVDRTIYCAFDLDH